MRNVVIATAALAIEAAMAAPASASVIYDNLNPTSAIADCTFSTSCSPNDFAAQLFTLSAPATILSGAFSELDPGSATTSVNYAFYNDVGGLPSGSALVSGSALTTTTTVGVVSTVLGNLTANLETFNISPAAALLAGNYFFAIQSVNSSSKSYLQQGLVTSGAAQSINGGLTWSADFEELGGVSVALSDTALFPATPLPSTWTMLIAGLVGLGFLTYRGSKKGNAALAAT